MCKMGLQDISWLTNDERNVFYDFNKLVGSGGYATSNDRQSKFFSYFWIAQSFLMSAVLIGSTLHFSERFDLIAYCLHHGVLAFDDFAVVYIFWANRKGVLSVMTHATWSYNYNSNIVEDYSKKIIRDRIRMLQIIRNCIIVGGFVIFIEVQVFFLLEVVYFQTYQTIYPIYFGLDLNLWPVYLFTVAWQESTVFVTTILGVAPCSLAFTVWSHLTIEIKILKFAVEHVNEIVEEQAKETVSEYDHRNKKNDMYELYCYHFAKHHASILQYFGEFKNAMSWVTTLIFVTGFFIMVAVGLTTFLESTSVKLKLFGFLVAQLFVIYGWCWVGQDISDHGNEISEAIMGANWWLMPSSCASTLRLIMVGCRIPLALTTPFGQIANNECCMDMLKGAYQMVSVVYQATGR